MPGVQNLFEGVSLDFAQQDEVASQMMLETPPSSYWVGYHDQSIRYGVLAVVGTRLLSSTQRHQ
jgi:hypothetical protein